MTTQLTSIHPTDVERQTGIFQRMPKIPRLYREMIVTEKLDGTNASIFVGENGEVKAASRTRWITPESDNYGFAKFVKSREDDIRAGLGVGHHFGEWFGNGIQRGYGLPQKYFALFNVQRWISRENLVDFPTQLDPTKMSVPPEGFEVVPILGWGTFDTGSVDSALRMLKERGSMMVPGWMKPEGIVVYHKAGDVLFKVTLDKNDGHKEEK